MEMEKAAESFFETWREIYNSSENEINEIWGKEIKDILIEKFEEEDKLNKGWIKEHMEMAMRIKGAISSINLPVLKEETLKDLLKN